jgi:hypothetical protein
MCASFLSTGNELAIFLVFFSYFSPDFSRDWRPQSSAAFVACLCGLPLAPSVHSFVPYGVMARAQKRLAQACRAGDLERAQFLLEGPEVVC